MSNKSKVISYIIIILIVLVITGFLGVRSMIRTRKNESLLIVEEYLIENNIDHMAEIKQIRYNKSIGGYTIEIVFEDEPKNVYHFTVLSRRLYMITAYDQQNTEITDKKLANYLID